ncbi:MAG: hypothetical protein ABSC08_17190, partial [Bryobacteraceae bacterium]
MKYRKSFLKQGLPGMILSLLVLLAGCFLLFPALVSAQSVSGELVGTIYDATGATVPGASVVAINVTTG